jgi:hypothetical protein
MFSQQPHRACLGSFLAYFLCKGDLSSHFEAVEPPVQHAVAVKIDLASITRFNESEVTYLIEAHDRSCGPGFVELHLVLQAANLVLKLPARPFEGIIKGEV